MSLTVHNRTKHTDISFNDYLAIDAKSNSFFKQNVNGVMPEFTTTEKMALGSMVDTLLTNSTGSKIIDHASPLFPQAKRIADKIHKQFGHILDKCEKQVAYTADLHVDSFTLRCKTLIDFVLPNLATIELKVTEAKDVNALIEFMGYDHQCFLERTLASVPKSYLLIHSTTTNLTTMLDRACPDSQVWLIDKVYEYGVAN